MNESEHFKLCFYLSKRLIDTVPGLYNFLNYIHQKKYHI